MRDFWIKLGAVTVTIIALYYLMSPYQQCMRLTESYADFAADVLKSYSRETEVTPDEYKSQIGYSCRRQTSW